jgi:hypothetical protein
MPATLSDALHARLDQLGAEPREAARQPVDGPVDLEDETSLDAEDAEQSEAEADEPLDADDEFTAAEDEGDEAADNDEQADAPQKWKLSEFAEATGLSPEDLYNDLLIPLGDGADPVPLGELKHRVQKLDQETAAVNEARAQIQQQYAELQQQQQQFVQGQQALSDEVRDASSKVAAIEAQYAQVDWERLEEADPGRAANYRQKFATAYAGAKQELDQAEQRTQQQQQQAMQQAMAMHNQRLAQLVPRWQDPKVFQEEAQQVMQTLVQELGWDPEELGSIYHGPARATAYWAWKGLMAEKSQKEAVGKIRKAPKKVLRSGRPLGQKQQLDRRLKSLESRALSTGRTDDKLAAARAIVQASRSKRGR